VRLVVYDKSLTVIMEYLGEDTSRPIFNRAQVLQYCSAVTYNPHYVYYFSPFPSDSHLGSVTELTPVPGLLLLNSLELSLRATLLQKAAAHAQESGSSVSIKARMDTLIWHG
jgi:hypothetical protein